MIFIFIYFYSQFSIYLFLLFFFPSIFFSTVISSWQLWVWGLQFYSLLIGIPSCSTWWNESIDRSWHWHIHIFCDIVSDHCCVLFGADSRLWSLAGWGDPVPITTPCALTRGEEMTACAVTRFQYAASPRRLGRGHIIWPRFTISGLARYYVLPRLPGNIPTCAISCMEHNSMGAGRSSTHGHHPLSPTCI